MQDVGCFDTLMYERVEKHCVRDLGSSAHSVQQQSYFAPMSL